MNKNIVIGAAVLAIIAVGAFALFVNRVPDDSITASYASGSTVVNATFNTADDTVTFSHPELGTVTLPRAISASGARYASTDESIVFWEHQGELTITKDGANVFVGAIK